MIIKYLRILIFSISTLLLATNLKANNIEGEYTINGTKETVTIKKLEHEKYSVSCTTQEGKDIVSKGIRVVGLKRSRYLFHR